MRNDLLFGVFPYLALGLLAVVPLLRVASPAAQRQSLPAALRDTRHLYLGSFAWRLALGLILLGHLGLLLPSPRGLWGHVPGGTMTLEASAFGLSLLALAGWASLVRERLRSARHFLRPADTLFLTLLVLGIGSGLVMTFAYHLGSAWYAVTLAPYLRSLLALRPDVALVADLPPIVRLHLLSATATVAVLPFTALGPTLAWPFVALSRAAAGRVRRAGAAG